MQKPFKKVKKARFVVGIDEVGRGPLAGPVAVGAVCVPASRRLIVRKVFKGIKDSKKLSPSAREEWAKLIREESRKGNLSYCVCFASNAAIDRKGIAPVIRSLVARSLKRLKSVPETTEVLLDGSLCAPGMFARQRTIIRGDGKIMEISMASVIAKVVRDRKMVRYSKYFPEYGFDVNKGYGTKMHTAAIKKYGLSGLHRSSFCGAFSPDLFIALAKSGGKGGGTRSF